MKKSARVQIDGVIAANGDALAKKRRMRLHDLVTNLLVEELKRAGIDPYFDGETLTLGTSVTEVSRKSQSG